MRRLAADNEVVVTRKANTRHPIDRHAGARLRIRRIEMRLSQTALAHKLGITFQAVQKYEAGAVRLSAGRLYDLAQALQVAPAFCFEAYDDDAAPEEPLIGIDRREVAALLRGYHGIRDPQVQADVRRLIARLGHDEPE